MQAMVLAAGMGKRMGKYTKECTKCMVAVGGKRIIDRTIEALTLAGITKVIMVIGYKGKGLEEYLKSSVKGVEFKFIYNKDYQNTNNIYSLYLAKEELLKDDTILLESDLIYDYKIIENIVAAPHENMVTVAKYEQWMDGTVVLLDADKNIIDFVEKADFRFEEAEDYYKTVNIYKFSKEFSKDQYIPFLEAYIKAYGVNQYYELVLKILAHVRYSKMKAMVLNEHNWYEIDDVQDLQIASTIFAEDDKQFCSYDHQYGGFWRFPKLKDFCYLVNPYYPPKKMVDHMKYFYETLLRQYPSGIQTQNLNAGRMFDIDEKYLLVGNGAAELISAMGKILKGSLLTVVPVFNEYVRCFPQCDIHKIHSAEYGFQLDRDAIETYLEGIETLAIVNPDNPSGNYIRYDEMMQLLESCKKRDILCIIDESFIDFAEERIRYTLIEKSILDRYQNLVVVKSISKSYGVPGIRLGIIATSNEAILSNVKKELPIWNINSLAEYFLQIHGIYVEEYSYACNQIAKQREQMELQLGKISCLKVFPSQANYIMCRLQNSVSATELANILAKEYNILIKDLSNKDGIPDGGYIRLAVKDREENDELVEAMKKILS